MFLNGFAALIIEGAMTTIKLALLSMLLAVLLGLLGATAKLAKSRVLRHLATIYTTLIRAVPDLVLMLLLFYSLQMLLNNLTEWMQVAQFDIDPFVSGVVTLGFIYWAYFTETFRGALQAVPTGQIEAALAYGMGRWQVFRRVLFPQLEPPGKPGRFTIPAMGEVDTLI